ncbi:putative TetR family transcriptional regulator [Mycobacterium tuberculosis]|nr:putative TetR family transcriptional regulator [Mycobacterium tuberculosis]CKN02408.1 putative TetR family transcriptional regulator [Mycobacterium tuberculosis]
MLVSLMQFVTDLTPPPQLVAVWAEERGFAGLYVPEKTHVPISRSTPWPGGELPDWYRRCYDPVVALAAAAAVTTRLRVGTGACLVAVHDPILLAKQIASLCAMSGERFVLGVGFGWNVEELADHGVPFADRIAVTVDKLAAMRALWAAEPVHYEGTHASVPPSWAWPKPAVAPPVLFGCRPSARAFEVIARHGDGWQPIEGYGELLGALPMLHAAFERAGRDPATAQVCVYSSAGDPATLHEYRRAGVAEVALALPSAGRDQVLAALDRSAPWWMRSPETTGRSKAMPSADVGRQTRAQILRAAMDIASVKGLSGLSIGELAGRLGMSKSGLFRHFGAKEQLQLATVEAAVSVFEAEVVAPAMAAPPGVDRVRALMHAWVGYLERDVFPGGCFFAAAAADVDSQPGPVRDRIAATGRAGIAAITADVETAQRRGEIRADIEARQLAFELHAYAMEANWALLLLDDDGAGERARTAIDAALARVGTTQEGVES